MTNLTIRPWSPGDLLAGRGPKREVFLSPDGLAAARFPDWSALLPWGASGYGLVGESDAPGSALVYACARPRHDQWDVVYLAGPADGDDEAALALWPPLLERLCQEAGRHGVLRVFARLDERAGEVDAFRRAGFVVYSRDRLWRREPDAAPAPPAAPLPATWRAQRGSDAWAVHRLYCALAPALVQQSEGLTSRDWRPPARRWFGLGEGPRGYVLVSAGEVKAHLCVNRLPDETRLRLLAHPDARGALGALFGSDLAAVDAAPARPVTVLTPEYSGWAAGILEAAGFQPAGAHLLLVRHTAAWARVAEPWPRRTAKEALEPAPVAPATSAAPAGGENP